jgi:hypothetical protein
MAHAESITFEEFRTRFSSEDSCWAELFRLRFPNGFICQKCGCTEYYSVRGRNAFQCRACRHQTSVTAGTVMHRTHLPLTVWFWAIYLCATDKRGISAVQRRGTDKAKIVVALSKTENGAALFTRMQVVEDVTGGTLQQVVDETVAPGSKIECDGYRSYRNLTGITLDAKTYEPGDLHWLHKAISNLKAFLLGTYHGRCTQLQAYLDEFCFRFNRRKTGDQIFLRLARAVAASCAQLR